MIDQGKLKELFWYDPIVGVFVRKKTIGSRGMVGAIAGTKNSHGYIIIKIEGKLYKAHRLAWLYVYGRHPSEHIDHIDRNKTNNSIYNLRECNGAQNMGNTVSIGKVGLKGVQVAGKRYRAQIKINGVNTCLGTYKTKLEAKEAYDKRAYEIYGEFYRP